MLVPLPRWVLVLLFALTTPVGASAFVWPNASERVERRLASDVAQERRQAAAQIAELPRSVAERLVRLALKDADTEVRLAALDAALRLRIAGVSEFVIPWLNHPERRVRMAAIELLRVSPNDAASAPLGRALSDPDPAIRQSAAEALAAAKAASATLYLLSHLDDPMPRVREAIARALAQLADPRSVVPLIGKVQDTHASVRESVVRTLGELGDARASAALVLALADNEPAVRAAAARALGRLRQDSATLSLVSLVDKDSSLQVRTQAIWALGEVASKPAISALIGYLGLELSQAEASEVRNAGMAALQSLGAQAVDELTACVATELSMRRVNGCAEVLGRLQHKPAVATLTTALRAGRVDRGAGLRALGAIGDPAGLPAALEYLAAPDAQVRRAAIEACEQLLSGTVEEGRAVDPISAALNAPDLLASERVQLAHILGLTRSRRAAPTLMTMASDANDVTLRRAALQALGRLGPAGQHQVLLRALNDEEPTVRLAAALALRQAANASTASELLSRLRRAAEQDRRALLLALTGAVRVQKDQAVTRAIAELAQVSRGGTRDALFEALAGARTPGIEKLLAQQLSPTATVADRAKLAEGLAQHPGAESLLLELAGDVDGSVRANAVWSLGAVGTAKVRPTLVRLLSDRDVAVAGNAVAALGRLAERSKGSSSAELCQALGDKRSYVRANALAALRVAKSRCPESPARELLRVDAAPLVRQRAAALLVAVPSTETASDQRALRRCFIDEPIGAVAASCKGATTNSKRHMEPATIFVVPSGEAEPVPHAPFALELGNGLVRLGLTDRRGAVYETNLPSGPLSLLVPAPLAP
jgi:HEAT repeat protein